MSTTKSISKNIVFNGILNIFNLVLPIVVMKGICDAIGDTYYGYISSGNTMYNYFYIFASFGISTYGLREMSKLRDDKVQARKTFTSLFIITTITNILFTIFYLIAVMALYKDKPFLPTCIILSLNLAFNIFYVEWVNQALENYSFITLKTIIIRSISYILMILFVRNQDHYYFYLFLLIVTNFFNNISSFIYIKKQIKFDFLDLNFRKHIKPMIYAVILSNVGVLYTQLDRFMIEAQINSTHVGYYDIAQRIITIINTLLLTLVTVTIPRLSNYIGNNLKAEYLSLLSKVSKTYLAILFPSSIGVMCLGKEIILIFGSQYASAIPVIIIFAIYSLTLGIQNILSNQIIYIYQKEREDSVLIFIGGIVNVALNFLLIKINMFTIANVIATTVVANFITTSLQYRLAKKCIGDNLNILNFEHMKYFLYSLIFFPLTILTKMIITNIYGICVITVLLCSSSYVLILFLTKDELFFQVKDRVVSRFQTILG